MPSFRLEVKIGRGHSRHWKIFIPMKRRKDETWVEYHTRT